MKLSEFNFDLPERLIAQTPPPERHQAKMMVLDRKTGDIIHARFQDFPQYCSLGDVLVFNTSKVIPARVWGKKEGRKIEFLFLKPKGERKWEVLCRPAKKVKTGDIVVFSQNLNGEVTAVGEEGKRTLKFNHENIIEELDRIGYAPLPPYIKRTARHEHLRELDLERYQTVFADRRGSIAAPTAGLHFTPEVLTALKCKGVEPAPLQLDVGLATFQPLRVENIDQHKMGEEGYFLSKNSANTINSAKKDGRPVTAVGTTSVRALESSAENSTVHPGDGMARLFIYPGFHFRIVDRLLTNFHLPQSSLILLAAAFAGRELILKAYRQAVEAEYRFYSYGDCILIL